MELAIVHETLADDGSVNAAAEAALKVDPDLAPRTPSSGDGSTRARSSFRC